jgi:hypothetical protein
VSTTAVEPRSTWPAPAGRTWAFVTAWRGPPAQAGTLVGEITDARTRKLHFDLYGPATASFTLDGRSASAPTIQELSQDLFAYRWNTATGQQDMMFRGPIGTTRDTISETTHTLEVAASDYRAMYARTVVGANTWTGQDQAYIAWGLTLPTQGGQAFPYNLGVSWDGVYNPDNSYNSIYNTGVPRDRAYVGSEKLADMLNNLAACQGGFDWGLLAADPRIWGAQVSAKMRLWYPQRGITQPFVAEYGVTVASLTRQVQSTDFANWVRNDGQATGGTPLYTVSPGDVVTNPQNHPEGLWQESISNASTLVAATLQQQGDGELALKSVLQPTYSIVLATGAWAGMATCWLGDTIELRVASGRLAVDTQVRIVAVDIDVDDDGVELVTLTVGRPAVTLASLANDQNARLDALSRR